MLVGFKHDYRVGKKMTSKRYIECVLILTFIVAQSACSGSARLADEAVNKLSAAKYYYKQMDYPRARQSSSDALSLWKTIKKRKWRSYPDWAIENNIHACEELLELIPTLESPKTTTVVPIRIVKGMILVKALLNQTENATFILDTGAELTLLTPELASRVKINSGMDEKRGTIRVVGGQTFDIPVVTLPQIQLGEASVKNLTVGIYQIFPDRPCIGGLIGADYLTNFTVTIDQGISKLKLISR